MPSAADVLPDYITKDPRIAAAVVAAEAHAAKTDAPVRYFIVRDGVVSGAWASQGWGAARSVGMVRELRRALGDDSGPEAGKVELVALTRSEFLARSSDTILGGDGPSRLWFRA